MRSVECRGWGQQAGQGRCYALAGVHGRRVLAAACSHVCLLGHAACLPIHTWAAHSTHPPTHPPNRSSRSTEFHQNGELLLTAGLDRRVRLFSVDGVK